MSKLLGFVLALAFSLTLLTLAILGADWVAKGFLNHPRFVPSGWFSTFAGFGGMALAFGALKHRRRNQAEQSVPLTPLIRRSPLTGLREL